MKEKKVKEENPKVEEIPTEVEGKEPEVKSFELGDLVVDCKCGNRVVMAEGIKGGFNFQIVTNEISQIKLVCEKCESELVLHFIESKQKESKDESVPEESKEEESV